MCKHTTTIYICGHQTRNMLPTSPTCTNGHLHPHGPNALFHTCKVRRICPQCTAENEALGNAILEENQRLADARRFRELHGVLDGAGLQLDGGAGDAMRFEDGKRAVDGTYEAERKVRMLGTHPEVVAWSRGVAEAEAPGMDRVVEGGPVGYGS